MLKITAAAAETVRQHGREGYPFEICGLLIGTATGEARDVREAWPLRNAWEDDPEQRAEMFRALEGEGATASAEAWEAEDTSRRFFVSPREQMLAEKRARAMGLQVVGVYHTHPNHPAVPSAFDRSIAWEGWSYVIVSVREGEVAEFRSWTIEEDGPFQEERVSEE
jgi:proteasome lid subunit RPN8/RPN11